MGIENIDYAEIEARLLAHSDIAQERVNLHMQRESMTREQYAEEKRKLFARMYGLTKGPAV